ncbi:hypothetical protein PR048_014031 [Dryococelus australis]|uniref:Uncharacterized protein n=1 Tax=Dryococelus australis TaxID=614101 RepID=A0ABQ9HVH5_9NEOP|nr:hypothetical protein PR048_014031 [Dryococelus australis]
MVKQFSLSISDPISDRVSNHDGATGLKGASREVQICTLVLVRLVPVVGRFCALTITRFRVPKYRHACPLLPGHVPFLSLVTCPARSLRISAKSNRARRRHWSASFLGDLPFPPSLRSGATPYTPRFTLIGSQDLAVKIHRNRFTLIYLLFFRNAILSDHYKRMPEWFPSGGQGLSLEEGFIELNARLLQRDLSTSSLVHACITVLPTTATAAAHAAAFHNVALRQYHGLVGRQPFLHLGKYSGDSPPIEYGQKLTRSKQTSIGKCATSKCSCVRADTAAQGRNEEKSMLVALANCDRIRDKHMLGAPSDDVRCTIRCHGQKSNGVRSGERGSQERGSPFLSASGILCVEEVTHIPVEMGWYTIVLQPHPFSGGERNILQ